MVVLTFTRGNNNWILCVPCWGQEAGLPWSCLGPQETVFYLACWVDDQHFIIYSITKHLINGEWSWLLSRWRENRPQQCFFFRIFEWIQRARDVSGLDFLRDWEVSERWTVIPILLISGITFWNVGLIYTLWYFEIERAIPFQGLKPPSAILWEALISFNYFFSS